MKVTTILPVIASIAAVSAHNPKVLGPSQGHHLHRVRSLCSRDVHCILTHEATEGPFYIPDPLIRSNITEDRIGVPLNLQINVLDVTKCEPAKNVWVDIWHADAVGEYSGWATGDAPFTLTDMPGIFTRDASKSFDHDGPPHDGHPHDGPPHDGPPRHGPPPFSHTPPESSRWLRGVAQTDDAGLATFDTVMPAWYAGRTTHIHIRIHTGNTTIEDGMLMGEGRVAHTGQLYFADELVLELAKTAEPYRTHARTLTPKLNEDDGIYMHSDGQEQLITVKKDSGIFMGTVTVGVDPSADHHRDEGMPGGTRGPHRHGIVWNAIVGVLAICIVLLVGYIGMGWYRNRRTGGYIALPTDERQSVQNESE